MAYFLLSFNSLNFSRSLPPSLQSHENMFIFEGKLLLLSFIFIYLIHTPTLAQLDFLIGSFCQGGNYSVDSAYQRNLDATLSALPTTNNGFGFYNRSTGLGSDRVNSVALCRGDVNPDVCLSCVNDSIENLPQVCPNQKEAILYLDYCLLRYSNEGILGNTQKEFNMSLFNALNVTVTDGFRDALGSILNELIGEAAAGGPLLKFATGKTNQSDNTRIYALVQCTPDLSEQQCRICFDDLISSYPGLFDGRIGARIIQPTCSFRYETYRFFNETVQVISLPPPPSPLPPSTPTPTPGMDFIYFKAFTFGFFVLY
ncbi:putative Gnk2-like domain-containing protein [Helianthus annuus]|nr:putative Gnk2-like domain-containing protein [Helianthus annuus]